MNVSEKTHGPKDIPYQGAQWGEGILIKEETAKASLAEGFVSVQGPNYRHPV